MKTELGELDSKKRPDKLVESFDDVVDLGIEAAAEMVSAKLPKGQKAWDSKEYQIAETAAKGAKDATMAEVLSVIGTWWADQIHGSPIGRNVQAWNHLVGAME